MAGQAGSPSRRQHSLLKYMYLHIRRDYFDIINDNWSQGWSEANGKTRYPAYSKYACALKFTALSGNEEYYTMRDGEQTKSMTG